MDHGDYGHGVPSWVDLSSSDLDASRTFYSALFGWEVPEGPPETGGYTVATLRGRTVAGLGTQMNPDLPPVWTTYVNVDDAAAVAARVPEHGGTVVFGPMQVMEAGTMAIFLDNIGAAIGVWEPGEHRGAELVNEHGTYTWSELISTDLDASKAFYGAVFGWDAVDLGPVDGGGPPAYTEWKVEGNSVGGMLAKNEMMPAEMPPTWGVYFAVDHCDAAVDRAKGLGATLLAGPMDIEPGRFAVLLDNVGAAFDVIQLKPGMGG